MQSGLVVHAMTVILFLGSPMIDDRGKILTSPAADEIERERAVAAFFMQQDRCHIVVLAIMAGRSPPGTVGRAGVAAIAFCIGTDLGLVAASAGGRTVTVTMRIVAPQHSFPSILVAP